MFFEIKFKESNFEKKQSFRKYRDFEQNNFANTRSKCDFEKNFPPRMVIAKKIMFSKKFLYKNLSN